MISVHHAVKCELLNAYIMQYSHVFNIQCFYTLPRQNLIVGASVQLLHMYSAIAALKFIRFHL